MDYETQNKGFGLTAMKTVNFTYDWSIQNFSLYRGNFPIESPKFSDTSKKYMFYMRLILKFEYEIKSLQIQIISEPCSSKCLIDFSIVDKKGEERIKLIPKAYNTSVDVIKNDDLMYLKKDLSDDILRIRCKLRIIDEIKNYNFQNMIEFNHKDYQLEIYNGLEKLLKNKDFTDITLIVDGKKFTAHKAILAARSPVFYAAFNNDMKEKATNQIEILDFESNVIDEMLRYIYTGKVSNIDQYSYDLLRVADKYELTGLKVLCEQFLVQNLSITKCFKILAYSHQCNCEWLKNQVILFIKAQGKCVIKSSDFREFNDIEPILAIELLSAILENV